MLNLNAYTGKDLSNFLAMLNQMEQEKVTEIRWMRDKIAKHLEARLIGDKKAHGAMRFKYKGKSDKTNHSLTLCPSCETGYLRAVNNADGLKIEGCPKCRYSRIKEKILVPMIK